MAIEFGYSYSFHYYLVVVMVSLLVVSMFVVVAVWNSHSHNSLLDKVSKKTKQTFLFGMKFKKTVCDGVIFKVIYREVSVYHWGFTNLKKRSYSMLL